jgi:hypothetical protein
MGPAQGIDVSIEILAQVELGMAYHSAHVIEEGDEIPPRWELALVAWASHLEVSPHLLSAKCCLGNYQAALLNHADHACAWAPSAFPVVAG